MDFKNKYLKYKLKYLNYKNNLHNTNIIGGKPINLENAFNDIKLNEPLDFSTIHEPIKDVKITNRFIFLFYSDFVVFISYTTDCCETSNFKLVNLNKLIKYNSDKNVVYNENVIKNQHFFVYKEDDNLLIKPKQLIGKQVSNISYVGSVNLPYSKKEEYDENKLYKISLTDSSFFYFLLRISSNGFYSALVNTGKMSYEQYNLINDYVKKYLGHKFEYTYTSSF